MVFLYSSFFFVMLWDCTCTFIIRFPYYGAITLGYNTLVSLRIFTCWREPSITCRRSICHDNCKSQRIFYCICRFTFAKWLQPDILRHTEVQLSQPGMLGLAEVQLSRKTILPEIACLYPFLTTCRDYSWTAIGHCGDVGPRHELRAKLLEAFYNTRQQDGNSTAWLAGTDKYWVSFKHWLDHGQSVWCENIIMLLSTKSS